MISYAQLAQYILQSSRKLKGGDSGSLQLDRKLREMRFISAPVRHIEAF